MAPIIKVFIDRNGNFKKAEVTSIKQVRRGFPVIDENGTAYSILKRLSAQDFPESTAEFTEDGLIR